MASFAVVAWKKQGGSLLHPEQLEVCHFKKLILGDNPLKIGTKVSMQFKQALWEGDIISLHEKRKDAEKNINDMETNVTPVPDLSSERKRKKKTYGDDFVDSNQQEKVPKQKEKSSASLNRQEKSKMQKKSKKQEKPKDKSQEKKKTQNQEKTIEQQRLLLTRMSNFDSDFSNDSDDDISFQIARSVVDECMDILNGSDISGISEGRNNQQSPSPTFNRETTLTAPDHTNYQQIPSLTTVPTALTSQINTPRTTVTAVNTNMLTPLTTVNTNLLNDSPIQLQPRNLTYHSNSSSASTPLSSRSATHPQFGGKCPRRRPAASGDNCHSCQLLREEILHLKQQLALYQETDQASPRPGKLNPALATKFKMIELSPGSSVFVYEKHIDQAMCKKSATACASFLMNCFYTNTEMEGMNLSGANGKPHPDKAVLDSIIAFSVKKFTSTSAAAIKVALRNKFAANNCRAEKRAKT